MIKLTAIILILLLTGCGFIEDLKKVEFVKSKPEPLPVVEPINTTEEVKEDIEIYEGKQNIFIKLATSILIVDDKKTLIDAPNNLKTINLLKTLDLDYLDSMIVTIDKEEHNGGIPLVVVTSPPNTVYDNGVNSKIRREYLERLDNYNRYWERENTSIKILMKNYQFDNFYFYVPYSDGLSSDKDMNSIVVAYDKFLLYMSDCYGSCEQDVPFVGVKFLVLANGGNCPTNSFEFILRTGADYVIAERVCDELKAELDAISVRYYETDKDGMINIIKDGDEFEIKTGG